MSPSPTPAGEPLEVRVDRVRLEVAHLVTDLDPTLVSRHVFEALERAHDELTAAIREHRRRAVPPHPAMSSR